MLAVQTFLMCRTLTAIDVISGENVTMQIDWLHLVAGSSVVVSASVNMITFESSYRSSSSVRKTSPSATIERITNCKWSIMIQMLAKGAWIPFLGSVTRGACLPPYNLAEVIRTAVSPL